MSNTLTVGADPHLETAPSTTPRIGLVAWLPWATAYPIATALQERRFLADLEAACDGAPTEHTRSDTTACLNALRGGLTLAELLEHAPGLQPSRLFGAYLALDELRRASVAAWNAIVAEGSVDSLRRHGELAAGVVPVLIDRLHRSVTIDPENLPRVVRAAADDVESVRRMIERTERLLDRCFDVEDAVALSQTMYHPMAECLFGRPDHLPTRVGSLMPSQVAALLGERVVAGRPAA
jgi:hypothetical protein